MAEPTLYERLGGIYAIAAVVDHFSDQLLKNPKVAEANPDLSASAERPLYRLSALPAAWSNGPSRPV